MVSCCGEKSHIRVDCTAGRRDIILILSGLMITCIVIVLTSAHTTTSCSNILTLKLRNEICIVVPCRWNTNFIRHFKQVIQVHLLRFQPYIQLWTFLNLDWFCCFRFFALRAHTGLRRYQIFTVSILGSACCLQICNFQWVGFRTIGRTTGQENLRVPCPLLLNACWVGSLRLMLLLLMCLSSDLYAGSWLRWQVSWLPAGASSSSLLLPNEWTITPCRATTLLLLMSVMVMMVITLLLVGNGWRSSLLNRMQIILSLRSTLMIRGGSNTSS